VKLVKTKYHSFVRFSIIFVFKNQSKNKSTRIYFQSVLVCNVFAVRFVAIISFCNFLKFLTILYRISDTKYI